MKKNALLLILLLIFISCSSDDDAASPLINEETIDEIETGPELSGSFVSVSHPTSGVATISEDRTELRLTNFKTDNGPLIELYIATDANATEFVSLGVIGKIGTMDAIEGDVTFALPDDINLNTHKYVMVWCVDFSVNFGQALLE